MDDSAVKESVLVVETGTGVVLGGGTLVNVDTTGIVTGVAVVAGEEDEQGDHVVDARERLGGGA